MSTCGHLIDFGRSAPLITRKHDIVNTSSSDLRFKPAPGTEGGPETRGDTTSTHMSRIF